MGTKQIRSLNRLKRSYLNLVKIQITFHFAVMHCKSDLYSVILFRLEETSHTKIIMNTNKANPQIKTHLLTRTHMTMAFLHQPRTNWCSRHGAFCSDCWNVWTVLWPRNRFLNTILGKDSTEIHVWQILIDNSRNNIYKAIQH